MIRNPEFLADPLAHRFRPKREVNKAHLAFVASLPCCLCGRPAGSVVHHLMRDVPRGLAWRSADRYTIPLCDAEHRALHLDGNERSFLAKHSVDGPALAAALWSVSGDYEMGVKIVLGKE